MLTFNLSPSNLASTFRRLPTGLGYAGNFTKQRQLPETEPAHLKLAQITARPAAPAATIPATDLEFRFLQQLRHHGSARHRLSLHLFLSRLVLLFGRRFARLGARCPP